MRTFARLIGSLLVAGGVASCSQGAALGEPSASPPSSDGRAVIATIVTQDTRIAVFGRQHDLRVAVSKLDGTAVADGLTLAELRVQHPDAYELVTSSYASNSGVYLDATYIAPASSDTDRLP